MLNKIIHLFIHFSSKCFIQVLVNLEFIHTVQGSRGLMVIQGPSTSNKNELNENSFVVLFIYYSDLASLNPKKSTPKPFLS